MTESGSVSPDADAAADMRARWIARGVLFGAILVAYANSFYGPMVFDDIVSVVNNASLRSPVYWLTPPQEMAGVGGRPLLNLTLGLNYAAGGLAPAGYHVVNLAIHLGNAALVFALVRRLLLGPRLRERFGGDAVWLALAVAGLWAVHPLQTESVTYISQRAESLWSLALLVVLYALVRSLTAGTTRLVVRWRSVAVGACWAGMLFKETMVVAPVMAFLVDATFFGGTWRETWRARGRFYLVLASAWLLLAWSMATSRLEARGVGYGLEVSAVQYALVQCGTLLNYLRKTLLPFGLVLDLGDVSELQAMGMDAWYRVVGALIMVGGVLAGWWRWRVAGFGALWLLLMLAPTSTVVPIAGQPLAEHRMYLPLLGPIALAVLLGYTWRGRLALKVAAGLAVVLALLTVLRNNDYRSAEAIWRDNLRHAPENPRGAGFLADALLEQGKLDEAATVLRAALKLRPKYGWLHDGYSRVLLAKGDFTQAELAARTAVDLMPTVMSAREQLVHILRAAGQPAAALQEMEIALKTIPDNAALRTDIADTLRDLGRKDEALAQATEAVRLAPGSFAAHGVLAMALLDADRLPEAIAHHWEWLRLQPDFHGVDYQFAEALMQKGQYAAAQTDLEEMLRRGPLNPTTLNHLGIVLVARGQRERARALFVRALEIQPDFALARSNLDVLEGRVPPPAAASPTPPATVPAAAPVLPPAPGSASVIVPSVAIPGTPPASGVVTPPTSSPAPASPASAASAPSAPSILRPAP